MTKAKKIVNGKNGLVCAFCGKVKEEVSFIIGACSKKPDWCMIYGTGKMACPDCYEKGSKEAEVLGDKMVAEHNKAARAYELNGRTWRGDECLTPDTMMAGEDD